MDRETHRLTGREKTERMREERGPKRKQFEVTTS